MYNNAKVERSSIVKNDHLQHSKKQKQEHFPWMKWKGDTKDCADMTHITVSWF